MSIESILYFLKEYNYVASYFGLILSMVIVWMSNSVQKELKNFQNKLIFKKRLPKILEEMDKNFSELNELLNKKCDYHDMKSHLNQYVDILRGLTEYNSSISNDLKTRIEKTKATIEEKFMENNIDNQAYDIKNSLIDIYNSLDRLKLENEEL